MLMSCEVFDNNIGRRKDGGFERARKAKGGGRKGDYREIEQGQGREEEAQELHDGFCCYLSTLSAFRVFELLTKKTLKRCLICVRVNLETDCLCFWRIEITSA